MLRLFSSAGLCPFISLAFLSVVVFAFFSSEAKAIELVIKNDLSPNEQGSMLVIEEARSAESPQTKTRFEVAPTEAKKITGGNATYFILTRVFPAHKLKYEVTCEPTATGSARLTLLKIHNGELPTGCKVTRTGHWSKRTGMSWDRL